MKKENGNYRRLFWYSLAVIAAVSVFLCIILNLSYVKDLVIRFFIALKPIFYALAIVFCVSGTVNVFESFFLRYLSKNKKQRKLSRVLGVVLGYLTFLLVIMALLVIVILPLVRSYPDIQNSIPAYIEGARGWIERTIDKIVFLSGQSERIMEYIDRSLDISYESISTIAPMIVGAANKIISEASNMLLGLIISIYIVCSREYIRKVKKRLTAAFLPEQKVVSFERYMMHVHSYFADFFSGRLLYSLIVGIVFYVVLWVMGVPLYSFISIMTGALVFVPVVGTVSAFGISVFLVFITAYELVGWYILVYVVLMLLGYIFLQKYIMKEKVRVSVTSALISVMIIGGLFGTIGTVMAVPVFLSVKLLFLNFIAKREKMKSSDAE